MRIQNLLYLFTLYSFLSCGSEKAKTQQKDSIILPEDSGSEPAPTVRDTVFDTIAITKEEPDSLNILSAGKHKITLQWISWDKPGYVDVKRDKDGWFKIKGEQRAEHEDEYLKIEGLIKPVTSKELLFRGTIETKVTEGNKGEPCIRTGSKIFLTKGSRKYWRLQDMLNCDAIVTDYVDIYF